MSRWQPSHAQKREFAKKMREVDAFCEEHGIRQSADSSSYYFTIDGQKYRVSNHTVAASNRGAYDWTGEQVREKYHPDGERGDTVYITAGKTRIMDIYDDLTHGYELDRRGNRRDAR